MTKGEKPERRFKWGLFLTGFILFLIAAWLEMSDLNYKASESAFPYRTAGWFILGFVFLALIACGFSAVFCLIARRFHKTAWGFMLIASSLFLFKAINSASPYNRLTKIIGEKAAGEAKLEEFYTGDSFNDGEWAYGIICGNESTMKPIAEYRELGHEISIPLQRYIFKNHKLPEKGDVYSDRNGYFFISPENNKIYFYWHSFINRKNHN